MAIGFVVAGIAIAAALSAYAIIQGKKNNSDNMQASEDYKPTMASEGSSIALIYGRVRIPGNIIWYGNLESETIEAEGGMGGKSGAMTGGADAGAGNFRYYSDCWEAIGIGKLNLISTYINDKEDAINALAADWNDGTQETYPSNIEYATRLKGVSHIYIHRMLLGDNTKQFPTIHFVVDRILQTPISYQNMSNGNNPAAVIYDLLVNQGGISQSLIDLTSFNQAATFWNSKNYGINLIFDSQMNVHEAIERILSYIPGIFFVNSSNQYALRALDPNANYDREITQADMKDFSFNRKTWTQTPNDFHATYISDADDYSERVVIAQNPAALRLAERKSTQTIDLKCFRKSNIASSRCWEIMKRDSYPAAQVKFKTNLKYSSMVPGETLRIYHEDYGLAGADFRISEIDYNPIDKNEIGITCEQNVETLHDDNFQESGQTYWTTPDRELIPPTYYGAFELPYTSRYKDKPAYVFLIERKKYFENGFALLTSSASDGDYIRSGNFTTFAQKIELVAEYGQTYDLDDDVGMTISFPSGKLDLSIDSISRENLFVLPRFIILESELMAFQTITPMGSLNYKLTGIIRGALGTTKATHAIHTTGWIAYFTNNIAQIERSSFYSKMLFQDWPNEIDPSLVTAFIADYSGKAKKPRDPGRLVATRTGTSVAVQIYPRTPGIPGAGDSTPEITDTDPPFPFEGDFKVSYSSTTEIKTTDSFTITLAGAFSLTIKSRLNGYESSGKTISIGASDGIYYA